MPMGGARGDQASGPRCQPVGNRGAGTLWMAQDGKLQISEWELARQIAQAL